MTIKPLNIPTTPTTPVRALTLIGRRAEATPPELTEEKARQIQHHHQIVLQANVYRACQIADKAITALQFEQEMRKKHEFMPLTPQIRKAI